MPVLARSASGVSSARIRPRASAAAARTGRPRPSRGWRRAASRPGQPARGTAPRARRAAPGQARRWARRRPAAPAGPGARRRGYARCSCPPDRLAATWSRGARPGRPPRRLDPRRSGRRRARRRSTGVLPRRQVGVDGRVLGGVPDAAAQLAVARRAAENADRAALDDLHADDGAHERRLAAAARPEQSDDRAARHLEGQVVQDRPAAAGDTEVPDLDGKIHHVLKLSPWCGAVKAPGPPRSTVSPEPCG